MTIDDLVAGFLSEAAAMKIEPALTYENWNTHHDNLERYADEFGRRDRLGELVPFLEQPEDWLAYVTGNELSQFDDTEQLALVTLDRLADSDDGGLAASLGDLARNMARHGDPRGAFQPPTEAQRAFLRVVTRGYLSAEKQIERCLISKWMNGHLGVRVLDRPTLTRDGDRLPGPTVVTGRDDFAMLESMLWINDRGMLVSIMVEPFDVKIIPDPIPYFIEAAHSNPTQLRY